MSAYKIRNMLRILIANPQHVADNVAMSFSRKIDLVLALKSRSGFLLGPRGIGKSFWIKKSLGQALRFDLLQEDLYLDLTRSPGRLAELIPPKIKQIVVLDEIQRVPALLNEVHRLMEDRGLKFLLTGSSARKLKRGVANLLGGRARIHQMFPLTTSELDFKKIDRLMSYGGLPLVFLSDDPIQDLKSYVNAYLKEEIISEALVRRVDHFVRFMDIFSRQSGEELIVEAVASDAGVPSRTVANYVEIMLDTLLAYEVLPYKMGKKRKAVSRSKLYLFDVGVANYMAGRLPLQLKTPEAGKAFEHLIGQELRAYLSYHGRDLPMTYWRTTTGIEVDFIIGQELALECKFKTQIGQSDLAGLRALSDEGNFKHRAIVCLEKRTRVTSDGIEIIPFKQFFKRLWLDHSWF